MHELKTVKIIKELESSSAKSILENKAASAEKTKSIKDAEVRINEMNAKMVELTANNSRIEADGKHIESQVALFPEALNDFFECTISSRLILIEQRIQTILSRLGDWGVDLLVHGLVGGDGESGSGPTPPNTRTHSMAEFADRILPALMHADACCNHRMKRYIFRRSVDACLAEACAFQNANRDNFFCTK